MKLRSDIEYQYETQTRKFRWHGFSKYTKIEPSGFFNKDDNGEYFSEFYTSIDNSVFELPMVYIEFDNSDDAFERIFKTDTELDDFVRELEDAGIELI